MRTTAAVSAAPAFPPSAAGLGRQRMDPLRRVALAAGLLYLLTFVASFPQLWLFKSLVDHPSRFVSTPGSNAAVQLGSCLEMVTAFAGIGTAIVLYPVTRRVSRTAALGFVTSRVIEAGLILVGVLSILTMVSLKTQFASATGAQADSLRVTGEALAAMRKWTFLLGPEVMAGINALFLGYVMHRGRLVPRVIPTMGLIGGPIILMSATVTVFGGWAQTSGTGFLCGILVAFWELSLGVYLTVKGFKPSTLRPPVQPVDGLVAALTPRMRVPLEAEQLHAGAATPADEQS